MEMHESRPTQNPAALARSWRIILPFAIVTPLVALVLTASKPATYESSADILSSRESFVLSNLQNYNFFYRARLIWTQAQLARLPRQGPQQGVGHDRKSCLSEARADAI